MFKPQVNVIFSHKKPRLGTSAPIHNFHQKKIHSLRFCIGQRPFLDLLQPLSGKSYQTAGRFRVEKLGELRYFGLMRNNMMNLEH